MNNLDTIDKLKVFDYLMEEFYKKFNAEFLKYYQELWLMYNGEKKPYHADTFEILSDSMRNQHSVIKELPNTLKMLQLKEKFSSLEILVSCSQFHFYPDLVDSQMREKNTELMKLILDELFSNWSTKLETEGQSTDN